MNIAQKHRVLVLNKLWAAVNVASLADAICLVYSNKAQIIVSNENFRTYTWNDWAKLRPQNDEVIRTAHESYRIPKVVLLNNYEKMPDHRVNFSRKAIYKRDNYQCQFCGCRPGPEELTLDHILPRSQGGLTTWTNCCLACVTCNSKKANRTPRQCGMVIQGWKPEGKRKEPYKPRFNLFKSDRIVIPDDWKHFVSEAYWNVELANDEVN